MIKTHPIAQQLSKLQISAKESVADSDIQNEDHLKEYLHITRKPEKLLKELILSSAEKPEQASLILVCGNVGDGKSHTLSYIQKDPEIKNVISQFNIHNDATESYSPKKSCIETLDDLLDCFSDEKLGTCTTKQIVAINLGTLSNFLADTGDKYSKLASYIKENHIIEEINSLQASKRNLHFSHVNFTDYHLFILTPDGAKMNILDVLLERIVAKDEKNPIYQAYLEVQKEAWSERCIIKLNYEYLFKEKNRSIISDLILRLIIKDKLIISVRQLLNFIYDLIVPSELSKTSVSKYVETISQYSSQEFLHNYIPFYLFDNPNISYIFNALKKLDPCNIRSESIDQDILDINTGKTALAKKVKDYETDHTITNWLFDNKLKRDFRTSFLIRIQHFSKDNINQKDDFKLYCKALYFDNTSQATKLAHIHDNIKKSIKNWYGNTYVNNKVVLMTESNQNKFRLFKDQKLKLIPQTVTCEIKNELLKFSTSLALVFEGVNNSTHPIKIDYGLFDLLNRINKGYRPNKIDRNNYIYFSNFIDNLFYEDAQSATVYIDEININHAIDYILEKDEYKRFSFKSWYNG